jgi:hypothetical protein
VSLKNEIEREFRVPVRVRAGAPGSLRIIVDGQEIYSKKQNPQLNTPGIMDVLRQRLPQSAS